MTYENDQRIVMTLDAGGTNFVFSAMQGGEEVVKPVTLPSNGHDLELCLNTMIDGFGQIKQKVPAEPIAISFAFPGPADYPSGIIGDLPNLKAFQGGVALGSMLEDKFRLPVFINNDGDLYAYGEAIAGFLPHINNLLESAKSPKRFKNLIGFTLGTGFGGGIVRDGELFIGDNSGGGEVWLLRNKLNPDMNAEEGVCIRAVQREYCKIVQIPFDQSPSPKDIYEIGLGNLEGNREAAQESYNRLAEILGDAIANVVTVIDGLVVIGGGVAGAHPLFLDQMVAEMNSNYTSPTGKKFRRLTQRAFNLENDADLKLFLAGDSKEITVPGTDRKVKYDPMSRTGVGISKIGTSKAVSIGAYAYALNQIG